MKEKSCFVVIVILTSTLRERLQFEIDILLSTKNFIQRAIIFHCIYFI